MQRRHFLGSLGALAGASCTPARAQDAPAPYDWQTLPFGGGGAVNGVVFHPRERGLVYLRTERGVFRQDTAGGRWQPLLEHLGVPDTDLGAVLSLALDPADPQRIYLACGAGTGQWSRQAALLVSSDRGATWQQHELDLRLGGADAGRASGERLQVDPQHGEVLLLGSTQDGLLRSSDRGRRFSRLSSPGKRISLVLFDAASGAPGTPCKTFYVGCQDEPGLYATRDGGQSFQREPGTPAQVPQRAAFAPDGSLYVSFALTEGGAAPVPGNLRTGSVWKREPAGTWREVTPLKAGGRHHGYAALDVDAQGRVVTSMLLEPWDGASDELFLSSDGGASWTALAARSRHATAAWPWLDEQMQHAEAMGHALVDARFDPHVPGRLLYGAQLGLWETADLGAALQPGGVVAWRFAAEGLELANAVSLASPSGGVMLFAAMSDGLGGAAWEDATKAPVAGLFRAGRESDRSIDVAWQAPAIAARTADGGTGGYVSQDGGASWRPFGAQTLVKDARGGHVAVSTKGTSLVWAPPRQPAMFSRDRGRTWAPCRGWPGADAGELVPVADKVVDGIFYVYDIAAGTVLASGDGGASFMPTITGLPGLNPGWQRAQIVSAPTSVRDLWIARPDGLWHTQGSDKPAKTVRDVHEARLVALGKAPPDSKYPSLYVWGRVGAKPVDGLFRSDDRGDSFRRIDDDRHRFGQLLALAADPLEHGTVYLAAQGGGVRIGKPRA